MRKSRFTDEQVIGFIEQAYAYRYPNSDARTAELQPWMRHYNFHRPHSATGHKPPASRLGLAVNNVLRNYS